MKACFSLAITFFIVGIGVGWLGKSWLDPFQFALTLPAVDDQQQRDQQQPAAQVENPSALAGETSEQTFGQTSQQSLTNSNGLTSSTTQASQNSGSQNERLTFEGNSTSASIISSFQNLLRDRLYDNAMVLYQDQRLKDSRIATEMRVVVLNELKLLLNSQDNNDFPALTESYLSVYYDDIDVLLLQADYYQGQGSYLEAVNVYLLGKTYAYSPADQQKVLNRFNDFVENTDRFYTNQKNWGPLINLYSHISTSGLMTSRHQYNQAFAHHRSGDDFFAIELFNQLLNDSQVGELAASALNNLKGGSEIPSVIHSPEWTDAESIALQKSGNQYTVELKNKRDNSVELLIDTGASMTAMSQASFDILNINGDAVEQERRVFRTANGPTTGTVFSIPELVLGQHLLTDTQIAVIDFDTNQKIDGLLGMNILDQFQFQIDQENARLLLSNKKSP